MENPDIQCLTRDDEEVSRVSEPKTSETSLLEQLLELVGERLSGAEADLVRKFSQAYLRRLFNEERGPSPQALFSEVLSIYQFVAERPPDKTMIRVFTPDYRRRNGGQGRSVVEVSTDDSPFLVDSVVAVLTGRDIGIPRMLHPVIGTMRNEEGRLVEIMRPTEGVVAESVMHFDLDRELSPELAEQVKQEIESVIASVVRIVRDFPAMEARLTHMIELARAAASRYDQEEINETVEFLEWLQRNNFVFLGYREYELVNEAFSVVNGSGLGLLADTTRSAYAQPVSLTKMPQKLRARALEGDLLIISKTNRLSPIWRRSRMDYIGIRKVNNQGEIYGEARLIGLFRPQAYAAPAENTPVVAAKLRQILAAEDLVEGSHDYRAAVSLFSSFPKDELFAAPTEDLRRAIVALLSKPAGQVRVLGRKSLDERTVSIIVALPRRGYDAALRERLQDFLAHTFAGSSIDTHEVLSDTNQVRLHFAVHVLEGTASELDVRELERQIQLIARTWEDQIEQLLSEQIGEEAASELSRRWLTRLPESYKAAVSPTTAVHDVLYFERLRSDQLGFIVGVQNEETVDGVVTRVGLYKRGGKVELSRAMPMLEHLGLRVVEERPVRLDGDDEIWLQDFGVLGSDNQPVDLDRCASSVAETITAVWHSQTESDALNKLVISADLSWQQVSNLRAYRKYRQRIGSRFAESYQNDVITGNPGITAKLVNLFELRFDPGLKDSDAAEEELRQSILRDLDDVVSLDHDRVLRNQLSLIIATVRTNAFMPDRNVFALKVRSGEVPAMPQPAPLYEIFVYSPEFEGIHMRGGKIARGGIRWSDRMDYRTEVFGLMRAQMTKNAIIVPTGAKGGFYVKEVPADPSELKAAVHRAYVRYIGGLLDLTDNLVEGEVVHPELVRVRDDDDTYLVVAADKGTATFSDTANEVAVKRNYWLGDAFASGGSNGYDHKKLGITARGAWESLKRHFRELERDPERDEFTVVGIGDMSGDVFGNGMLLSDKIRLVAAYDHRHIFIDPNPDGQRSIVERRRLFELPSSSWADYDRSLISEGGGVWPRTQKSIKLTPQIQALLGITDAQLAPSDLIRAVLRAPADVLWNGGIGTVVRASTESDDDARDRSNDGIRITATELQCAVVIEGGNLGLTQRARIEYAMRGGHITADFIDNSAGVDCSDHEVNLKVLLDLAVQRGELEVSERNPLLQSVTDQVVEHVLYDSFLQAQILAQEVRGSASRLYAYDDLMAGLEDEGVFSRAGQFLPSSAEMSDRRRTGHGMERPELALLISFTKRRLSDELLESDLPDVHYLEHDLQQYFPGAVVERLNGLLFDHPLRRELIAMLLSNQIVDSLGPTFASRLQTEEGASAADVVTAFRIAREVVGAGRRWAEIEELGTSIDADTQWELIAGVDWLVEATTRWYLRKVPARGIRPAITSARPKFEELDRLIPELGSDRQRGFRERRVDELVEKGVPVQLARRHAYSAGMIHAPDIIAVVQNTDRSLYEVGQAFYRIADVLDIGWLEQEIENLRPTSRMHRWAQNALRDDILLARKELAERALMASPDAPIEEAIERFLLLRQQGTERFTKFSRSLNVDGAPDLAGLTLAVRQLHELLDR